MIARVCERHGVKRIFGVPGGGSSLDIIAAFAARGIPYVLTRTETAAVIMAAATAEATGTIGVAMTTQGPGVASATNGVAQASLDRAPVILISDGWTKNQAAIDTKQVFDQRGVLAPLVKAATRLEGETIATELEELVATMQTPPWGPAYIELTGEAARRLVEDDEADVAPSPRPVSFGEPVPGDQFPGDQMRKAAAMLGRSRKPVILLGLEARTPGTSARVIELVERLGAPVLATYKAKGIVPDDHANLIGMFVGGAAEQDCVQQADLIVLLGLDPVELMGRPWPYPVPVLELGRVRHPVHYVEAATRVVGDIDAILEGLQVADGGGGWSRSDFPQLRRAMVERLAYRGDGAGLSPESVVRTAIEAARGLDARITCDAGAHMFSVMAFWPALRQGDVLISNGLSTMAFSLPAAIAMSIETPDRPVIAFTGDGGLLMCAGELSTAAQHGARLCVVVFNDRALSLIAIKQEARQLARKGVDWPPGDFAGAPRGSPRRGLFAPFVSAGARPFAAATTREMAPPLGASPPFT